MTASMAYMYPKADRTIKNTSVAYFAKMVCDRATRRPAVRSRASSERGLLKASSALGSELAVCAVR